MEFYLHGNGELMCIYETLAEVMADVASYVEHARGHCDDPEPCSDLFPLTITSTSEPFGCETTVCTIALENIA